MNRFFNRFADAVARQVVRKPQRTLWYADNVAMSGPSDHPTTNCDPASDADANLVSSLLDDGRHLPVFDIDFAAQLIPSSTEGHFHLYLDGMVPLTWPSYETLLKALADAGVMGDGYVAHAIDRKMTVVRRPGITKVIS